MCCCNPIQRYGLHRDCKQRTTVPAWTCNSRENKKIAKLISMRDESKPAVETQIRLTMTRGNSQSTRRSHLTNAERQAIVYEFERRQNVRRRCVPERSSEWGFKELQLTTMPSQLTMSRLCKKRSHAYGECFVNPNRKQKWEGMHAEFDKALLT